jgi:hypothetical protein
MNRVRLSKGWKVTISDYPTDYANQLLVCNYTSLNEVQVYSFNPSTIEKYRESRDRRNIGIWKLKK